MHSPLGAFPFQKNRTRLRRHTRSLVTSGIEEVVCEIIKVGMHYANETERKRMVTRLHCEEHSPSAKFGVNACVSSILAPGLFISCFWRTCPKVHKSEYISYWLSVPATRQLAAFFPSFVFEYSL
jgi:hypothetical protein